METALEHAPVTPPIPVIPEWRSSVLTTTTGYSLRIVLGILVFLSVLFIYIAIGIKPEGIWSIWITMLILAFIVGPIFSPAKAAAKGMQQAGRYLTEIPDSGESFALLLRAFEDDTDLKGTSHVDAGIFGAPKSAEERLIKRFKDQVSTFVAIGRPQEPYPASGAARIYFSDADWKEAVRVMTERARAVFLRVGKTPGLAWEVEHCLAKLDPQKFVLWVPHGTDSEASKAFIAATAGAWPHALPADLPEFLLFEADWRPVIDGESQMKGLPPRLPGALETSIEPKNYGGIGRSVFLCWLVAAVALGLSLARLLPDLPIAGYTATALILVAGWHRCKNIGKHPAWSLLFLVPLANLLCLAWCLLAPEGYGDHKKLDMPAKVVAGLLVTALTLYLFWIRYSLDLE